MKLNTYKKRIIYFWIDYDSKTNDRNLSKYRLVIGNCDKYILK